MNQNQGQQNQGGQQQGGGQQGDKGDQRQGGDVFEGEPELVRRQSVEPLVPRPKR
jgi:hypothetical protein